MNKHTNPIQSIGSALKGLGHGFKGRNFRLQSICALAVLILSYWLPLQGLERIVVFIVIALVLSAELFNSAIEELADVLIQEHHPGIAKVKELSATAVFILAIISAIVGVMIFLPYL